MKATRRGTIGGAAAAATGITFLSTRGYAANETVNVALIGIGGKGVQTLTQLDGNCNLVAFADCYWLESRAGVSMQNYPDVPLYKDFRVMLDRHDKEIDAVCIATPDHTHHYIAKTCLMRGKHVYVEKPMAHNIREVRDLMQAEQETGLICQMGNQGHSGMGIEYLRAWVDAGVLGDIKEVRAWMNRGTCGKGDQFKSFLPAQPEPETLDWNLWLGPAGHVPFNEGYAPRNWRIWKHFGNGPLGDFACHNMDNAYDALGLDCPSAVKIESNGKSEFSYPTSSKLTFTFESPKYGTIPFKWYEGRDFKPEPPEGFEEGRTLGSVFGGTLIIGSKATVMTGSHAGVPRIVPEARHKELARSLPKPEFSKRSHHHLNWIRAIKGEEKNRSPFSYSGRLTEAMMYGLISMNLYRDIKIDPKKRRVIGDREALAMMKGPEPRKGWDCFG